MAEEIKDVSSQLSAGVDSEETKEPALDKELSLAVKKLSREQRDLYESLLMQRREELQERGEDCRNVPVEERWGLLEGIKNGEVCPAEKGSSQLPNVNWEKVRRDFEERWPTFIEKSLPRGDRD